MNVKHIECESAAAALAYANDIVRKGGYAYVLKGNIVSVYE